MTPYFEHNATPIIPYHITEPYSFPLHLHLDIKLIYMSEGEMIVGYPDKDYHVKAGDFLIIFPYTVHSFKTLTPNVDFMSIICNHMICNDFEETLFNFHPESPIINNKRISQEIEKYIYELRDIDASKSENFLLIKYLIGVIFAKTLPLLKLNKNTSKFEKDLTVQAVKYVYDNFKEEISIDTAAKALNLSRNNVIKLFASNINVSFVRYVNSLRIDYAKTQLEATNKSILDIALEAGFGTLRTFNRTFKEYTSKTPLQYRNEYKKRI